MPTPSRRELVGGLLVLTILAGIAVTRGTEPYSTSAQVISDQAAAENDPAVTTPETASVSQQPADRERHTVAASQGALTRP